MAKKMFFFPLDVALKTSKFNSFRSQRITFKNSERKSINATKHVISIKQKYKVFII